MPSTRQHLRRSAGAALSPFRRWRNDPHGEQHAPGLAGAGDGEPEDERRAALGRRGVALPVDAPAPPDPLVLAPGTTLVAFDGGPAGRAALAFATRMLSGPLAVLHVWPEPDVLHVLGCAARSQGGATAGLQAVDREHERRRAHGERIAADGVALAEESGRPARAVVVGAPPGTPRHEVVRAVAERRGAAHLVVAVRPSSVWRRIGGGAAERLVAGASCPVTVVPVHDR